MHFGTHSHDQLLPSNTTKHVALDQEAKSTKHLFLFDASPTLQARSDARGELLIVGHTRV